MRCKNIQYKHNSGNTELKNVKHQLVYLFPDLKCLFNPFNLSKGSLLLFEFRYLTFEKKEFLTLPLVLHYTLFYWNFELKIFLWIWWQLSFCFHLYEINLDTVTLNKQKTKGSMWHPAQHSTKWHKAQSFRPPQLSTPAPIWAPIGVLVLRCGQVHRYHEAVESDCIDWLTT